MDVVDNISTMVKRIASNAEEIANEFEKIDTDFSQEEYYKLHAFGANNVKGKIQPRIASVFATKIKFILSCLPYLVRKHHWTLPQGIFVLDHSR